MVNESEFTNRHFETRGIIEPMARVRADYAPQQNQRELAHSMSQLLGTLLRSQKETTGKTASIERTVADRCDIPYNTYKKYIGLKRQITRVALAKFAVGLRLSLDDANKLFRLQGGELNETNDFDYIIIHALMDKDDIQDFQDEVKQYTRVNIHGTL
jgi:hypothetical protein